MSVRYEYCSECGQDYTVGCIDICVNCESEGKIKDTRIDRMESAVDKLVHVIHQNCSMCPASIDCELELWDDHACKERIKQWAFKLAKESEL